MTTKKQISERLMYEILSASNIADMCLAINALGEFVRTITLADVNCIELEGE